MQSCPFYDHLAEVITGKIASVITFDRDIDDYQGDLPPEFVTIVTEYGKISFPFQDPQVQKMGFESCLNQIIMSVLEKFQKQRPDLQGRLTVEMPQIIKGVKAIFLRRLTEQESMRILLEHIDECQNVNELLKEIEQNWYPRIYARLIEKESPIEEKFKKMGQSEEKPPSTIHQLLNDLLTIMFEGASDESQVKQKVKVFFEQALKECSSNERKDFFVACIPDNSESLQKLITLMSCASLSDADSPALRYKNPGRRRYGVQTIFLPLPPPQTGAARSNGVLVSAEASAAPPASSTPQPGLKKQQASSPERKGLFRPLW